MLVIIAIALVCVMYGFSLAVTSLVTFDKETLHNKREIIGFIIGIIVFIIGILLFLKAI